MACANFGQRPRDNRVADFLLRKMPGTRAAFACLLGALLAVLLAGCAGEVPVPFLNAALPPAPPGPAPEYPSIAPPVVEGTRTPIMTEAEREALETQLKKLVAEREGNVKKKIDKSDQ
jgi:hypothetical protein